jgi:iron complex outermembrane receptor protein
MPPSELDLFKLDAEVRSIVTTITKTEQELREAPSVVSVIGRDEIRARGYRSVAEVLAATAGFHVIDDLVLPDAGIRGAHGGVNGSSRLIKVMIDGQPVDFRPTTGYALGPELIPIEIVERIEIIRGPASALYGADAFLGVVSIITRDGGDVNAIGTGVRGGGMEVDRRGAPRRQLGVTLYGGTRRGSIELLAAASLDEQVRSGLSLPRSSPDYDRYGGDVHSAQDHALPRSFYGRASLDAGDVGAFRLSGGIIRTDADEEWVDTAVEIGRDLALTHGTRVSLENRHLRLEWTRPFGALQLVASTTYAEGSVAPDDRIDVNRAELVRVRRQAYRAIDVVLEARWQPQRRFALVGGVDYSHEWLDPARIYSLYTEEAGIYDPGDLILLTPPQATRTFDNGGIYGQVIYYPIDRLGVTAGVRLDRHSLYDLVPNGRLGLVTLLGRAAYAKLLVGTSFKAPSDDQLFAEPIYEGALRGNADLAEQRAATGEVVLGWDTPRLAASLTAFYTRIAAKVEFLPTGTALVADNVSSQETMGFELEGKLHERGLAGRSIDLQVWGNASLVAIEKRRERGVATTDIEPYPRFMANLGVDAAAPRWRLRVNAELRVVGAVPQHGSNVLIAEGRGVEAEDLDPYALLALTVSSMNLRPLGKETVITGRVTNVLDARVEHPGTGGVNVPGAGRTWWIGLVQEW